jgi:hypothetical protein
VFFYLNVVFNLFYSNKSRVEFKFEFCIPVSLVSLQLSYSYVNFLYSRWWNTYSNHMALCLYSQNAVSMHLAIIMHRCSINPPGLSQPITLGFERTESYSRWPSQKSLDSPKMNLFHLWGRGWNFQDVIMFVKIYLPSNGRKYDDAKRPGLFSIRGSGRVWRANKPIWLFWHQQNFEIIP